MQTESQRTHWYATWMRDYQEVLNSKLSSLPVPMNLVLPSGQVFGPKGANLRLSINDKPTLLKLTDGNLGALGEAIVEGRADFTGKVRDLMSAAVGLLNQDPTTESPRGNWLFNKLTNIKSRRAHTPSRDLEQIQFHYDLSDEFFELWLDPNRVYSCGYFKSEQDTLAVAQEAKLDLICKKLNLQAGERFLDIGCGWGGLMLWAAVHYKVHAVGITLSQHQFDYVSRRISEMGLEETVQVRLLDYRCLDSNTTFDKIASVGMFEHVGSAHLNEYFQSLLKLLRPGGWVLNHGITSGGIDCHNLGAGMGDFIEKYIFPGGELEPIQDVIRSVAASGLEIVDVENLRPHYAKTLWAWSRNLEEQLDIALSVLRKRMPAEQAVKVLRAYRLYLAGCAIGFEQGWSSLYQILAIRPGPKTKDSYPYTRHFIYEAQRN